MARRVQFEGRVLEVPDDATDDEIAEIIGAASEPAGYDPRTAALQPKPEAPDTRGVIGKIKGMAEGILEPAVTLGTGLVAMPVGAVAGAAADLYARAKGAGKPEAIGAELGTDVQKALTYVPRSQEGQENLESLGKAFNASKLAGLPVVGSELPQAMSAAAQVAPSARIAAGAARQTATAPIARAVAPQFEKAATINTLRAPEAAVVSKLKEAGYNLPPSRVNPSMLNKKLEEVAGRSDIAAKLSSEGQETTNALVRSDLGIEGPLTAENLAKARAEAGKIYDALSKTGVMSVDDTLRAELSGSAPDSLGRFPNIMTRDPKIQGMLDDILSKDTLDAAEVVELMKKLRRDSSVNTAPTVTDTTQLELGRVQKQVAKALESFTDRQLEAKGLGDMMKKFREDRTQIAKIKTVEKVTNPTSGNVNAQKLGDQLNKGAFMSGDLKTAAEYGSLFRPYARTPERLGSPIGGHERGSWLSHVPLLRTAAEHTIMSRPYQRMMVDTPIAKAPLWARIGRSIAGEEQPRGGLSVMNESYIPERMYAPRVGEAPRASPLMQLADETPPLGGERYWNPRSGDVQLNTRMDIMNTPEAIRLQRIIDKGGKEAPKARHDLEKLLQSSKTSGQPPGFNPPERPWATPLYQGYETVPFGGETKALRRPIQHGFSRKP